MVHLRPDRALLGSIRRRGGDVMAVTSSLQTLTAEEVVARLRALRSRQPVKFWAFYSSQLGGIVTDPALMVVPFDDHMQHRGHGTFDTRPIQAGTQCDLEAPHE